MDEDILRVFYLAAALILPLSALAAYRLSWRKSVLLVLVWASIFAGVTAFISLVRG